MHSSFGSFPNVIGAEHVKLALIQPCGGVFTLRPLCDRSSAGLLEELVGRRPSLRHTPPVPVVFNPLFGQIGHQPLSVVPRANGTRVSKIEAMTKDLSEETLREQMFDLVANLAESTSLELDKTIAELKAKDKKAGDE